MAEDKILMGIDQSLTGTGIAISTYGEFTYHLIGTAKTKNTKCPTIDRTRRLMLLKEEVKAIIKKYNPHMICMEGMAFGAQGAALMDIGGLSHIMRELFEEEGIPYIIAPPTVIKKFWTGKGNADKQLMIETAEFKGVDFPFKEKINKVEHLNNNVVDAHAMCEFLEHYEEYLEKIECSWDK